MIKRYTLVTGGPFDGPRMFEDDEGAWVRYDDHAAEVERLRAENERLRREAEDDASLIKTLESELLVARTAAHEARVQLRANRDAQREAAIYGAAIGKTMTHDVAAMKIAIENAERTVELWRAAQKGGPDE